MELQYKVKPITQQQWKQHFFQERTTEDSKESESFKELLTARTHEFIEEVLTPHFGNMIMFVKDCEGVIERGNPEALRHEDSKWFSLKTIEPDTYGIYILAIFQLFACRVIFHDFFSRLLIFLQNKHFRNTQRILLGIQSECQTV